MNRTLAAYRDTYRAIEERFVAAAESYGLEFEPVESSPRAQRPDAQGAPSWLRCENGGASLRRGPISPACVACRTSQRTETFFVSLRCTRSCYFCFNPNQESFEHFCTHRRDIAAELRRAHARGEQFDFLAVTGGEPALELPSVLEFLSTASALYPNASVRLYTSGDLLDARALGELALAGLDEIRFSVKPEESPEGYRLLLDCMGQALACIPRVLVEMPAIPGTDAWMERLLLDLDALGVHGINLLEFCFPFHNAQEFARRGFKLRRRPYDPLYDYWYAGGLPIAGSERLCLDLLAFAERAGLRMGVHYCSLDNKHTGQVYRQNEPHAAAFDTCLFSGRDYFLKSYKAFGDDVEPVLDALRRAGEARYRVDPQVPNVEFHPEALEAVRPAVRSGELGLCRHVVEERDGEVVLRELAVDAVVAADAPGADAL